MKYAAHRMHVCLSLVIAAALEVAAPKDRAEWEEKMKSRIRDEGCELYDQVGVRARPIILKTVGVDNDNLDSEACVAQICFQLCMHSDLNKWSSGLNEASELIHTLGQAANFEARDIYDIFNAKLHFTKNATA